MTSPQLFLADALKPYWCTDEVNDMKSRRVDKGYTILELMIVVVILGLLLSIMIISYNQMLSKTNRTVCLANQKSIEIARQYNYNENQTFGSNMIEMEEVFEVIGFMGSGGIEDLVCPTGGSYAFVDGKADIVCSIVSHNN